MRLTTVSAGVFVLCLSLSAQAQPDAAARAAAREIAYEAVTAFEGKRFAQALEKFERAYAVLRAPSLGLYSARCMVELGRWVDAAERFHDVTRLPLDNFEEGRRREIQSEAQVDAAKERRALLPRIPKVVIRVVGSGAAAAIVTIDGREVPKALVGTPWPVDPGQHVARISGTPVEQSFSLKEGETTTVELELSDTPTPPAETTPPAAAPTVAPVAEAPPHAVAETAPPSSGMRTAGFIGLGVGAGGVALGVVAAGLAASKKGDLDSRCLGSRCPPQVASDVGSYDRYRTLSTVGFIVGGVGVATGVTLLLVAPNERAPRVSIAFGPTGATASGRF